MKLPTLPLTLLPSVLAVSRLPADAALPRWTEESRAFLTISSTPTELSITAEQRVVPNDVRAERGYRAFMVQGPLPFDLIGIFASMATPLAEAGLAIFAISTFDTDYVLVKQNDLPKALDALRGAGHTITEG